MELGSFVARPNRFCFDLLRTLSDDNFSRLMSKKSKRIRGNLRLAKWSHLGCS